MPNNSIQDKLAAFERILTIMDELREACPWDKKQSFESLRTMTIEEVYELADAVTKKNWPEVKKELGDVFLHIIFYARLGNEAGHFDVADVITALEEKLIYRHPHIYGDTKANNPDEVAERWEELKLKEKGNKTVLQGIPDALPALIKAMRLQQKARGVGFDWDKKEQVWDKVKEEIAEFEHEIKQGNSDKMEAEFGDLFFSLVNTARLYGINPEDALERTNQKFTKRFNYLESKTISQGQKLSDMSLDEMDAIWEEAKHLDNQ